MTILTRVSATLLATAVAAVIGSAPLLAQSADTQSGNTSQSAPQMNPPTHPGANQWARDRDWYARPGVPGYGWMGPHAGWMMGGGGPGWMMGHRPGWMGHHAGWRRGHRGPRGARFTFTRGNARVDIQCPANQPLKECVDAASTLIDKVGSMGPPAPGQPKPPAGNSGPNPGNMPGGNMPNMPGNRM
jgi:hypothetical protein